MAGIIQKSGCTYKCSLKAKPVKTSIKPYLLVTETSKRSIKIPQLMGHVRAGKFNSITGYILLSIMFSLVPVYSSQLP